MIRQIRREYDRNCVKTNFCSVLFKAEFTFSLQVAQSKHDIFLTISLKYDKITVANILS